MLAGRNKQLRAGEWHLTPPGMESSGWEFGGFRNHFLSAFVWPDKYPEGVGRILYVIRGDSHADNT